MRHRAAETSFMMNVSFGWLDKSTSCEKVSFGIDWDLMGCLRGGDLDEDIGHSREEGAVPSYTRPS